MSSLLFYVLVALAGLVAIGAGEEKKHAKPCTIRSPSTDKFFDLTPISVKLPKVHKDDREESWQARGYDYPANFTLNFCAPVVEELQDVVGVDKDLWKNISAYYELDGKTYSIGQQNSEPVFRGRKLVLNYTDGSPCSSHSKRGLLSHEAKSLQARKLIGGDDGDKKDKKDDDKEKDDHKAKEPDLGRKSTIISLLCEKDPMASLATVAFVGASPDECTYFFEARSSAACGGIEIESQSLGPAGVFGVIALIAVLVYVVGGCVYQRTVKHQRGWRQLPNYALWAGISNFVMDFFVILTSSCTRFLPGRRGYSRVTLNGNTRGRSSHAEDENRLIDQLDEEWDD